MNQCDGCRRGLPVINGRHDLTGTTGSYPGEQMGCTAHLYQPNTTNQHGEWLKHSRGSKATMISQSDLDHLQSIARRLGDEHYFEKLRKAYEQEQMNKPDTFAELYFASCIDN